MSEAGSLVATGFATTPTTEVLMSNVPVPADSAIVNPTSGSIRALFERVRPGQTTTSIRTAIATGRPYLWQSGEVEGATGRFWISALFDGARLEDSLRGIVKKKGISFDEAVSMMARFHSGLGKSVVSLSLFAQVEIDHLARAEQEARYAALSAATGMDWALSVFSGGKSVHNYLAFTSAITAQDIRREQVQKLLVVCLEGDTHITDPGRLMRMPGYVGEDRKQPILHLDVNAHYEVDDIIRRLTTYAASLGITDVDRAFRALQHAEDLCSAAKPERTSDSERADEMREHAAHLRQNRGSVSDSDLRIGKLLLPVLQGSSTASMSKSGGLVVRYPAEVLAPFQSLAKLTQIGAPCCPNQMKGVVMHEPHEPTRLYCNKHGHTILAERAPVVVLETEVRPHDVSHITFDEPPSRKAVVAPKETLTDSATPAFIQEGPSNPLNLARAIFREMAPTRVSALSLAVVDADTLDPLAPLSEEKMEALNADAAERYRALVGESSVCTAGLRFSGPGKNGAHAYFAAACGKLSCGICSVRVPASIVAAMTAVVGNWDLVGTWSVGVLEGTKNGQGIENLQRWEARNERYNLRTLTLMVSPTRSLTICCWKQDAAPSAQLGKKIVLSTGKTAVEVAKGIGAEFDHNAWAAQKSVKGDRSRYFRGEKSDMKLLSHLRRALLGLSAPGKKVSGWSPVWETPQEIVASLNAAAKQRGLGTTFDLVWDKGYKIFANGAADFPVHKMIVEFGLETRVKPSGIPVDLDGDDAMPSDMMMESA